MTVFETLGNDRQTVKDAMEQDSWTKCEIILNLNTNISGKEKDAEKDVLHFQMIEDDASMPNGDIELSNQKRDTNNFYQMYKRNLPKF